MLTINNIEPQIVAIYHSEGGFIGYANEYEFNDFRIQIKKNYYPGYYVSLVRTIHGYKNIGVDRYYIDIDGRLPNWPKELFPLIDQQLTELY